MNTVNNDNHTDSAYGSFADIAPYDDFQFHEKIQSLVREPGFEHAVRYIMPGIDFEALCKQMLSLPNRDAFQVKVMAPFLTGLEQRTTDGITSSGLENVDPSCSYTYISNHRDIVLDASFLNLVLLRGNKPLTQVAIGNNLLIFDWITDLVKLNRSFIVKRNVKRLEALNAARQLSAYIHYTINVTHESVWIAQREGRAKDSNDLTQESLIKMMALAGDGDIKENLLSINLLPVSISYEYDPNDYLKVKEYLLRRRDPEFKKCQHDDLLSMETGLVGYKGRVHFHTGRCINEELAGCNDTERGAVTREACRLIDRAIHSGYYFFPCNYIAYDMLEKTEHFAEHYSAEDVERFKQYIASRLTKVDIPDINCQERDFMWQTILSMYANPVKNNMAAAEKA